jgi:ribonuclease BN (tRNA processing enzyme)
MPAGHKGGAERNLELFLEVEFLHSLGCYSNARDKAGDKEYGFELGSIPDAGGALRRTHDLNWLLASDRDNPEMPSRHPDPAIVMDRGRGEGDPQLRSDEEGLLLADKDESRVRLRRITDFYSVGIAALDSLLEPPLSKPKPEVESLEHLGSCIFWDRDPGSSVAGVNRSFKKRQKALKKIRASPTREKREDALELNPSVRRRIEAKRERFVERRKAAEEALKPKLTHRPEWEAKLAGAAAAALYDTNLSESHADAVTPGFVLQCMVAAHLRLHHVEHFLSHPFKKAMGMSAVERDEALQSLREAESLNTFVYVASRSIPWLFATDEEEMEAVRDECRRGFGAGKKNASSGTLSPREARADVFDSLWRAQRISFLALHRRAFGHGLHDALVEKSFNDTSFKDFHKLQRQLRVQRRILNHVEKLIAKSGGEEEGKISPFVYVAGIDALAETHIGDLYRADHAHPIALGHFCDAQDQLDHLSDELLSAPDMEPPPVREQAEHPDLVAPQLRDSRWRIHLMMSKGKGFYEVGNLKRSVKWLLKSWSALLGLVHFEEGCLHEDEAGEPGEKLDHEAECEVFAQLSTAIRTLRQIKNDPDFSKEELAGIVKPIVKRLETTYIPPNVRVIAGEILLRLGHVLFVLRLDERERHQFAFRCLERAKAHDRFSTLVSADQLKIKHRRGETEDLVGTPALANHDMQWPFGRSNPDQIIRMIEYHLLWWLAVSNVHAQANDLSPGETFEDAEKREQDRQVARELIAGLLTHTDSINVRQSQVYRFLMQPKQPARSIGPAESWEEPERRDLGEAEDETAIEFVCLRRYSSFFPFVPRPSAFRSVGGGYLLRLHHRDASCPQPFGIAVDPGPDFIENLYRCGFGLGDINMIILTHDHPDHSVDLDPILALLGYRMKQGDRTFSSPSRDPSGDVQARRLLIVGNESVASQLRFFNKPHPSDPRAGDLGHLRRDAVQVVSFDEFEAYREEMDWVQDGTFLKPEVKIPWELRLKPVISIRHPDGYGMLAYGFRLSLGDAGPSIGFTGDTGGFRLEKVKGAADAEGGPPRWKIEPHDSFGTLKLTGDNTWRDHWADVLDADVLVPHVSGLPLSQLLVLANDGLSKFANTDKDLENILSSAWSGLEENVRRQVGFAFWLPESEEGIASLPLEEIQSSAGWPKGHLYLIGLLEFARAYLAERKWVNKPGLFLIGELREELGSLRGKIADSINTGIFDSEPADGTGEGKRGCRALTADVGMRLMISRGKGEARVRVLCSTCDLDNDRTRGERFHDPTEIREVCVKGENEGMFYNCSNHDPSRHVHPVFLERVERYDVFSPPPVR